MSNVRSITQAYLSYASANRGRYPPTGTYDWGGGGWGKFWPDILIDEGFLGTERTGERDGVFWDPAEENHHGIADYGPSDNVIPHSREVPPAVKILDPAKTVLISESRREMGEGEYGGSWWLKAGNWIASAPNPQGSGSPLPARHDGSLHVGFCDGHVERISERRAIEERETLFTGPYDSTNPDYNP
jgi:prepilin-type processing-associated H-X9-DG protein